MVHVALALMVVSATSWAGPPGAPRIFEGEEAQTCQWPTTVLLTSKDSLCSGALIHPRLVVTAAHCVDPDAPPFDVKFGELHYSPGRKVEVDTCMRNPEYDGEVGGTDIAFCTLVEAVEQIPPTPPPFGCERSIVQFGWPVTMVGFGRPDDELQSGTKRWAESRIQSVVEDDSLEALIGEPGASACSGDSGGPAYVQYPTDGSWHAIAVESGGNIGCGSSAKIYVLLHPWIPWMEQASGLDLTPCHDLDGSWNPGDRCGGFAVDPLQDAVQWADWCASGRSGVNATCGDPYAGELYDPFAEEAPPGSGCECRLDGRRGAGGALLLALGVGALGRRRRPRRGSGNLRGAAVSGTRHEESSAAIDPRG